MPVKKVCHRQQPQRWHCPACRCGWPSQRMRLRVVQWRVMPASGSFRWLHAPMIFFAAPSRAERAPREMGKLRALVSRSLFPTTPRLLPVSAPNNR